MLLQIVEHGIQRLPQRKTDGGTRLGVVRAQSAGEVRHLYIRPHPGRPPVELRQHARAPRSCSALTIHPTIHPEAVGPVAFHPDEREIVFGNQSPCERSSPAVILGRAMRRLAQKNESGITDRCRSGSMLASSVSGVARSRISEGVMAAPVPVVRVSMLSSAP
jgi:hypothetical protein